MSPFPHPVESLRLPKVRQLGIVVRDLEKSLDHHRRMFGLGPWYRPRLAGRWRAERAGRTIASEIDIAVAYSGSLQIELIEVLRGEDDIYTEHLRRHGEGLHHVGFSVRNLGRRLDRAAEMGIEVLQSGRFRTAGGAVTRYAYLDTAEVGGVVFELIETRLYGLPVGMSPGIFRIGRWTREVEPIR